MVDAYVANHLTSVEQLYPQLYRHTEDQLILLENVTDSYRLIDSPVSYRTTDYTSNHSPSSKMKVSLSSC